MQWRGKKVVGNNNKGRRCKQCIAGGGSSTTGGGVVVEEKAAGAPPQQQLPATDTTTVCSSSSSRTTRIEEEKMEAQRVCAAAEGAAVRQAEADVKEMRTSLRSWEQRGRRAEDAAERAKGEVEALRASLRASEAHVAEVAEQASGEAEALRTSLVEEQARLRRSEADLKAVRRSRRKSEAHVAELQAYVQHSEGMSRQEMFALRQALHAAETSLAESTSPHPGRLAERLREACLEGVSLVELNALNSVLVATGVRVAKAVEHQQRVQQRAAEARQQEAEEGNQCVVCLDAARATLFLPCRHRIACAACAAAVTECPACRAAIQQRIECYG
jgi:chromosome segregation ATPase